MILKKTLPVLFCLFIVSLAYGTSYSYDDLINLTPDAQKRALELGIEHIAGPEAQLTFEELKGGFSKAQLYTFVHNDKKYVLRLLNPLKPSTFRNQEVQAQTIANKLDLAPEVVFADPDPMIIIMPFVEGHTLTAEDLNDDKILTKLGQMIRTLHSYSGEFSKKISQVSRACKHYERALEKRIAFPTSFQQHYDQFVAEQEGQQKCKTFCHGDLNPGNVLVGRDRLYIIDWTNATWDNPHNDLGYLTLFINMTDEQSRIFLNGYHGRESTPEEWLQLKLGEKRTAFLAATVWFDFSENAEDQKIPKEIRIKNLDQQLANPEIKTARYYIQEKKRCGPDPSSTEEFRLYAIAYLKEYLLASHTDPTSLSHQGQEEEHSLLPLPPI